MFPDSYDPQSDVFISITFLWELQYISFDTESVFVRVIPRSDRTKTYNVEQRIEHGFSFWLVIKLWQWFCWSRLYLRNTRDQLPSINCRPCQHLQSECCVFWGIQLCIHICNIWLALHGFRKKKNWTFFRVILLFVCLWCCDVCWCSLQQIIRINFHMTRVVLVEWRSMNNSWYTALMERVEPSWTSKQQLT